MGCTMTLVCKGDGAASARDVSPPSLSPDISAASLSAAATEAWPAHACRGERARRFVWAASPL